MAASIRDRLRAVKCPADIIDAIINGALKQLSIVMAEATSQSFYQVG